MHLLITWLNNQLINYLEPLPKRVKYSLLQYLDNLQKTLEMDDSFLDTDTHHHHDNSITSFGIHIEGQFKIDKLNDWLNKLLMEKGQDIYRSKGILSIVGSNERYVYQSVHMIMKLNSSN